MEKNYPINTKNHARFNKQKEQLTESLLPLIEKNLHNRYNFNLCTYPLARYPAPPYSEGDLGS